MTDLWDERKKALENQYIQQKEKEQIEKLRAAARDEQAREAARNRCPKCGQALQAITFRGVPLDKCPDCGGVWLGPQDLQALAEKDHRSWFDKWFRSEED